MLKFHCSVKKSTWENLDKMLHFMRWGWSGDCGLRILFEAFWYVLSMPFIYQFKILSKLYNWVCTKGRKTAARKYLLRLQQATFNFSLDR